MAIATPTPATAQEQKAFYEEQGYLVLPQLLDRPELDALRAALAEVLEDAEGLTQSNKKFTISPTDDGQQSVVRRIFSPNAYHQAFRDLIVNPKLLDIVENLIGPDIQLHMTNLNLKPAGCRDAAFVWHQDWSSFPHTNFDLLAVMVFLDDALEENGCLQLVAGSHKWGPQPHLFSEAGVQLGVEDKRLVQPSRLRNVLAPAGGIEVHHCNLLHGSAPNSGTEPRSAMVVWYRAADNVALGGSTAPYGSGTVVRGKRPHRVRMIGGVFPMSV